MKDITCLVTGANSGLGLAMAKGLAQTGATVVMVCRDPKKGKKARIEVIAESQNPNVDLMIADLSSLEEVKQLARNYEAQYGALHLLANLAGLDYPRIGISADGLEINFATNVLGPFVLTDLLLDLMIHSRPSTIINVSGEAHRTGAIYFNDLQLVNKFTWIAAKGQSALARVTWTNELSRRLESTGVTANTFCPGRTRTNINRHFPLLFRWIKDFRDRFYGQMPKAAMAPILHFVLTQALKGVSGKYLSEGKVISAVPISYHTGIGKKLWWTCERMAGLEGAANEVISKAGSIYNPFNFQE